MDKFSFLNAAHTTLFESLYEQYRTAPDSVEPSWKAFFQGFDFGAESVLEDWDLEELAEGQISNAKNGTTAAVPESVQKEFQVVKLINGYRSRSMAIDHVDIYLLRPTQFVSEENTLQLWSYPILVCLS